jgi:hypothetical protein
MNVQEPFKLNEVNFSNIVFKKTKLMKNKKIIFLKYKSNKINNFVIQLSKIHNNNVNNSNEIEFIIDNKNYISFFENLDNYIIEQAQHNHLWFDHLENTSSLNYQRILQDNNSIKLSLCNNEELVTKLVINEEEANNFDDVISNDSTSKIILEIYAVWIKSTGFGLLLRPVNISMKFKEKLIYNYKFLDDSENESTVSEVSDSHFQTEQHNMYEADSDNELSDDNNSDNELSDDNNSHSEGDFNASNNNQLFIKSQGLFNNNTSPTSSNETENNLNKLILG